MQDQSPAGAKNSRGAGRSPLPFGAGVTWLHGGLALIRLQPLRLMVLGMMLQFLATLSQTGLLGLLFLLTIPVFSAGMLQAVERTSRGQRPSLGVLFVAFRSGPRLPRLLLLGALGLGCLVLAVGLMLVGSLQDMDPALLARLESGDAAALGDLDPAFVRRLLLGLALGLFVSGAINFFAVPLTWFSELPLGAALTRGVAGLFRHWRPLLVLLVLLILVAVPMVALAGLALTAQASGAGFAPLTSLLMMLVGVFYQLLLFSAQFACFESAFGGRRILGEREVPEDQLVA